MSALPLTCQFPALPKPTVDVERRDLSSDSEESVNSAMHRPVKKMVQTKNLLQCLEDVAETRRRIKQARRKGKRYVQPKLKVSLKKTVYEDTMCFLYLDGRSNDITVDVPKGTRIEINGFETFEQTGETWYRISYPYLRYWIHEGALKRPLQTLRRTQAVRKTKQHTATPKPTTPEFSYKETVDCFVDGVWLRGDVQKTCNPLQVNVQGRLVEPQPECVRKVHGKTLRVCIDSLPIRSSKTGARGVVKKVPKDGLVEVISFEGYFAKVHKPCVGWIQWRSEDRVAVLEPQFKNPFLGEQYALSRDISVSGWKLPVGARVFLVKIEGDTCRIRFTRNCPEGKREILGTCPLSALRQRGVAQPQIRVTNLPADTSAFELSKFVSDFSFENYGPNLDLGDFKTQTNKKGELSLLIDVHDGNREVHARILVQLAKNTGCIYKGQKLMFDYSLAYLKAKSCPFNWIPESKV